MEENKIHCANCGDLIENDAYDTVNGETVCPDCIERHTTTCDRCGNTVWMQDSYGDEYTTLCRHCYENHYTRCSCCDSLIHEDDGMEIVTYPMTLEFHKNFCWEDIMRKAISLGYRSHQTSTCGLHVHVNRDCMGETREEQEMVISKILYFTERHWNELLKFSRRSEYSMNRWAARYGFEKTGREILDKAPAPTPTQELAKIAALIAATCLASKVESIIIELAKEVNNDMVDNIKFKEVE